MKLVIGYGVSGQAAAKFLRLQGEDVVVVDRNKEGCISDENDLLLDQIDQVILSSGIPLTHPLAIKAKKNQIEVIGEIELGLRNMRNRAFCVTGTNGKTSTVLLAEHILNQSGISAYAVGNVGKSLTEYLCNGNQNDILIVELSSYQLETIETKAFEAGFILNISPNHLDRYANFEEYVRAKANIQKCIQDGGEQYISTEVETEFKSYFPCAKNFEKPLAFLKKLKYTQLEMPSKQSIQASYLLCKRCGVTDTEFLEKLKTFKKPEHRLEWVAEINGVSYYNDSKSSNVQSVIHAIRSFNGPLILIVGGTHKGSSYKPWIESFEGKVKKIIAYGKAAPMIECELSKHFSVETVDRFADAVNWAKIQADHRDTVLLSPGCSSFDQFQNYQHRGDEFKRLVRET